MLVDLLYLGSNYLDKQTYQTILVVHSTSKKKLRGEYFPFFNTSYIHVYTRYVYIFIFSHSHKLK